ncbi:hypothetical protein ACVWVP_002208, partial [Pseudomonas sp. TE24901]
SLWELSSFSEAAKAAGQVTSLLAVPPLSQASQLPQWIFVVAQIPVGAVELQRGCEGGGSGDITVDCAAAIAGKPAPTGYVFGLRTVCNRAFTASLAGCIGARSSQLINPSMASAALTGAGLGSMNIVFINGNN